MMPGDMPCNKPCGNTLCHYCIQGVCVDNCTCEYRMGVPSYWRSPDETENENDNEEEE